MGKQFYNVSYNGLDKEERIDCLAQIRRQENPPGSTFLDVDNLSKSTRSTHEDAMAAEEPREPNKFVRIGKINF